VTLTEIDRVRAPILIINGRDDNSPPSIIDVYVKKLRAAGKQVETYLPDMDLTDSISGGRIFRKAKKPRAVR
jgi:hypothetical protein